MADVQDKKNDDGAERRLNILERASEKTAERLGLIERDLAVIRSNYVTKADLANLEATMIRWFVGTAITLVGLGLAAGKYIL